MKMSAVKGKWEYAAVNVLGWAWADTPGRACGLLAQATRGGDAVWTERDTAKYLLRVFRFPKGCRCGWAFYCPIFDAATDEQYGGQSYWLVEDHMKDWGDGKLPIEMTIRQNDGER